MEKIKDILEFELTPIIAVVFAVVLDNMISSERGVLNVVITVVCAVVTVLSTLMNLSVYGKFMKYVTLGLSCIMILYSIVSVGQLNQESTSYNDSYASGSYGNNSYVSGNNNYYNYNNSYNNSSSNTSFTGSSSSGKTCNICGGKNQCHICKGKGQSYCPGLYCNNGICTSCVGGVYDHGSYVSSCLVCKGDGRCDICNGTGYRKCGLCNGKGICTHCH